MLKNQSYKIKAKEEHQRADIKKNKIKSMKCLKNYDCFKK